MLNVVCAVIGALLFVGCFLALFRGNLALGIVLLPVLLIAALVVAVYSLVKEVKDLRGRVRTLEEKLLPEPAESSAVSEETVATETKGD